MTRRRRRPGLTLAAALLLGATSTGAVVLWPGAADVPARRVDVAAPLVRGGPPPELGRSVPDRLMVPALALDAPLIELGLQPDRTVEVPPAGSPAAGWYRGSPTPGERGPAVLLGHVSSRTGPGVFHDLAALRRGDVVAVHRRDGSTARFRVDGVARYPKSDFPTGAVYGDLDRAGLRLVTCGGRLDHTTGHYRDDVVVYASAAA